MKSFEPNINHTRSGHGQTKHIQIFNFNRT